MTKDIIPTQEKLATASSVDSSAYFTTKLATASSADGSAGAARRLSAP